MFGLKRNILPVQTYGARVLKTVAAPVVGVTPEIRKMAEQMVETMFAFDGIGLAAPQVGSSLRLIVLGLPNKLPRDYVPSPGEMELLPLMPLALINPVLVSSGGKMVTQEEGCLSVPEIWAEVERPEQVVVRMEIIDHGPVVVACGGLLARCLQHEMDHLDGKLFVDRLKPAVMDEVKPQLDVLYRDGEARQFRRGGRRV
ncbi:MAG: peptide deformylase [Victivallales bacterium]|nr:peptide deformylase [Victivallales bacterium]